MSPPSQPARCPSCGLISAGPSCRRCGALVAPPPVAAPDDEPGLATPRQVRGLGAFFVLGGVALVVAFQGTYLRGLLPVPWLGYLVVALGLGCAAFPRSRPLRRRAYRVFHPGEDP